MGKELAGAMMNLLPPVGWADVATKRDLDGGEQRLDAKIDRLGERLDAKIESMQAGLKADLNELRADLQRTFVAWMFATQGAVVAAVGVLLALTR